MEAKSIKYNNTQGQSIYELVIVVGVVSLIMLTLVTMSMLAVRNADFAKNKNLASQYTQEISEWLRGQRDSGWLAFISSISGCSGAQHIRCMYSSPPVSPGSWTERCGTCGGTVIAGTFTRQVTFICKAASAPPGNPVGVAQASCNPTNTAINTVDAVITINWTDSQGVHTTTNTATYSNW